MKSPQIFEELYGQTQIAIVAWVVLLLGSVLTTAQEPNDDPGALQDKAYARRPREIVFQNDSQWEDNRWQQTDVGPFLAASITPPAGSRVKEPTLKGLAVRVGERGQAAICFDTARLRVSMAWTGEFLEFGPRRFGLIRLPAAAGELAFTTPKLAGWALDGRFQPSPEEITLPEVEQDYVQPGTSETRLAKEWAHYRGFYASGDRVVISYTIGKTLVWETPWYVESDSSAAFVRTFEVAPSAVPMQLWVGTSALQPVLDAEDGTLRLNSDQTILTIPAHESTLRFRLLWTTSSQADHISPLIELARGSGTPGNLRESDNGRFQRELQTVGTTTESSAPYVIDTLTLPFENPWKALLFTAGHDFFSDGSAAICTVHGDVWTVAGIDRNLSNLRWRRFATGLSQPLGLKIVDDKVFVVGRDQITRLHDRNLDGEADFYENFNNDTFVTPRTHDFVTCLDTDPQGNFYLIHAKTGVMKIAPDGSSMKSVARGFRNPNGMGVSPEGLITAAPQQGTWTPESSLIVVKDGGFYGFGGPEVSIQRPTGWDLPMCFIPRAMDNSGGGQVWVEGNRWGPLDGKMLHLSYGQCRMLLALTEEVGGDFQGGTIPFPTTPGDFQSGIMRGRFSPHDGQLYVSGLRGWQTRAIRDGCFERVRYTGGAVHLPIHVKTFGNGIKLQFAERLDREQAQDPRNFFVEQWNYLYSEQYGSPEFSVERPKEQGRDEVPVLSATVMDDGHSIFLEMPSLHPVHQICINYFLKSEAGSSFQGSYAHTINVQPMESMPTSSLLRLEPPSLVSEAEESRLRPQILFHLENHAGNISDARLSRLVTLRQNLDQPTTPFLPAGHFTLQTLGTLKVPLSGFYQFRLNGSGTARLWINDELIVESMGTDNSQDAILLRKGHNRLRVAYESPPAGLAELDLQWKGYNFGWEPIAPELLYHDSEDPALRMAQQRRDGRQLFAERNCARCHRTGVEPSNMLELQLDPPNLQGIGDRLNAAWITHWLLDPHQLRPGTSMPALLGTGEQARQSAADLTAFLLAQPQIVLEGEDDSKSMSEINGEQLYETLGCIACHHFNEPQESDAFNRVSLHFAKAKFSNATALRNYLRNPGRFHSATRMPQFELSSAEVSSLESYIQDKSHGVLSESVVKGNAQRGATLFASLGCQQCHDAGKEHPLRTAYLPLNLRASAANSLVVVAGCLGIDSEASSHIGIPDFHLNESERLALHSFCIGPQSQHSLESLSVADDIEMAERLITQLRCVACHDRDGIRAPRPLIFAEEGSGTLPTSLPSLTWAGDKFQPEWTRDLLLGNVTHKPRPWLAARMPSFPAFAQQISHGLALEHGVDPTQIADHSFDPELAEIGEELTRQNRLDCRQCHGIGEQEPRGDENTQIALGINFAFIRDRLRNASYHRFMLDPPRYDINTRMIKLSENGVTTKLRDYFDSDAHLQFEAIWNYIQSLPQN